MKWGGWIQELGDISPMQSLIIGTAKQEHADSFILQTQRSLTLHNMKILRCYAKLTNTYMAGDNSIRIVQSLIPTQEQKEAQE